MRFASFLIATYMGLLPSTSFGEGPSVNSISVDPKFVSTAEFCGRVNSLQTISGFSGNAISTDIDPRFVINIEIEKRLGEDTPVRYSSGKSLNFAIHSPSRLFGEPGESVVDNRYVFTYRWGPDGGPPAFSLKAVLVKDCR